MRALFYLSLFMLIYGSLYPFEYGFTPLDKIDWLPPIAMISKADILGNVALCIPAGLFAALYGMERRGWFILRILFTIFFAIAVQFAQIYIAERVPSMLDVVFNLIGLGAGLATAFVTRGFVVRYANHGIPPIIFMLTGAFLIYQLIPFVPSLDWGLVKENIKASLAASGQISPASFLRYAAYWFILGTIIMVAARDLKRTGWIFWLLLATILVIFGARVLIQNNTPTLIQFTGALAGSLFFVMTGFLRERRLWLALVMVTTILVSNGLTPWEMRADPRMISLMPFGGYLTGSMLANLTALAWKIYVYSTLIFLLIIMGLRPLMASLIVAALLAGLEATQMFIASGSPEITDPFLALIMGLILPGLMRAQTASPRRHAVDSLPQ